MIRLAKSVKDPTLCLAPGCSSTAATRGLCRPCYAHAVRAVRSGIVNWERLVRMGLAKESAYRTSPFQLALEAALRKEAKKAK